VDDLARKCEAIRDKLRPAPGLGALRRAQVLDAEEVAELEKPDELVRLARKRLAPVGLALGRHRAERHMGKVDHRRLQARDAVVALQVHRPRDLRAEDGEEGEKDAHQLMADRTPDIEIEVLLGVSEQEARDDAEERADRDLQPALWDYRAIAFENHIAELREERPHRCFVLEARRITAMVYHILRDAIFTKERLCLFLRSGPCCTHPFEGVPSSTGS